MKRCALVLSLMLAVPLGALAVPIKLDVVPYIQPNTTVPGNPSNQGVPTVQAWLQALVNEYNLLNDPDLPAVDATPAQDVTTPSGPLSLTISVLGYNYLTVHWGGPQDDSNDHSQAWYLGGSLASFTMTAPGQWGLSGYRLWNRVPVPDGGSTLGLLGLSLLALAGCARNRCRL
jgi:hypothetical protein